MLLPLGSVVKLDTDELWIITSHFYIMETKENQYGYFDYKAFSLVEGDRKDDEYIFFNHSDIEEVMFEGYSNFNLEQIIKNSLEWLKKQKIEQLTLDKALLEISQENTTDDKQSDDSSSLWFS